MADLFPRIDELAHFQLIAVILNRPVNGDQFSQRGKSTCFKRPGSDNGIGSHPDWDVARDKKL